MLYYNIILRFCSLMWFGIFGSHEPPFDADVCRFAELTWDEIWIVQWKKIIYTVVSQLKISSYTQTFKSAHKSVFIIIVLKAKKVPVLKSVYPLIITYQWQLINRYSWAVRDTAKTSQWGTDRFIFAGIFKYY